MTAVNIDIPVKMCATCKASVADTQVDTKADITSFKDVLANAMPVSQDIPKNNDSETETETNVKDIVTKLLQTLSTGCSDEDIKELTDGLSCDELDMLTKIIEKIAQIISQQTDTQGGTDEQTLLNSIIEMISNQSETIESLPQQKASHVNSGNEPIKTKKKNETDNKTSDETISEIAVAITQLISVPNEDVVDNSSKVDENILAENISNVSEKPEDKNSDVVSLLKDLSDKVSKSSPEESQFATKLQHISQEISKAFDTKQQLSDIKITDIKVLKNTQTQQSDKENLVLSNESYGKTQIKVSKNDSELSELTALIGNAKTDMTAVPIEKSETVQAPVENQVLNFIKSEVLPSIKSEGTTEMTMTLNPEELGKISVKLTKTGADLVVSIACDNSITQKMIENRLPQLISSLSSGENKTAQVTVVAPNQNASELMYNSNMAQQNGQQHLQSQHPHTHYVAENQIQNNSEDTEEFYREGRLWQTV